MRASKKSKIMKKAFSRKRRSIAMKEAWARKKEKTSPSRITYQGIEVKEIERFPTSDIINHPPHYTKGSFETIDVIEDIIQHYKPVDGFLVGQVIKYLARAPHKGDYLENLKKGQFYFNRLIDSYDKAIAP